MKLILTGASGFIGKHVCAYLDVRNIEYICMDIVGPPEFICNIQDPQAVTQFFQKHRPTHMLHLAWHAGKGYAQSFENIDWLTSSIHLVNAFYASGGQRFVGIGSCFEYALTGEVCHEDTTPTRPVTLYGKAKLAQANYLQAYAAGYNASWAWCRPFYILGPGEATHRLIPSACAHFLGKKIFECKTADSIVDYMDVRDVARALITVLEVSYTGIVNIATGQGQRVGDMLVHLAELALAHSPMLLCTPQAEVTHIVADVAILTHTIAFTPAYTLTQSLRDCYNEGKEIYLHAQ